MTWFGLISIECTNAKQKRRIGANVLHPNVIFQLFHRSTYIVQSFGLQWQLATFQTYTSCVRYAHHNKQNSWWISCWDGPHRDKKKFKDEHSDGIYVQCCLMSMVSYLCSWNEKPRFLFWNKFTKTERKIIYFQKHTAEFQDDTHLIH